MSGLYLFVLLTAWIIVGLVVYKTLGALKCMMPRILIVIIGAVIYSAWIGWPAWEVFGKKMYWDSKVRELCAVDGGVKVYKKVVLPEIEYDKLKSNGWRLPDISELTKEDKYYYEHDKQYIRKSNPKISRRQFRIYRLSDRKLLGESIRYGREGGDLTGPWHFSSYTCPSPTKKPYLEPSIFVKE